MNAYLVLLVVKNVEAQAASLIPSPPTASTSIALRNRSRSFGLTRTLTHSASMRTSPLSARRAPHRAIAGSDITIIVSSDTLREM